MSPCLRRAQSSCSRSPEMASILRLGAPSRDSTRNCRYLRASRRSATVTSHLSLSSSAIADAGPGALTGSGATKVDILS